MSTPAHTRLSVQQILTKNNMTPLHPFPPLFNQSCPKQLFLVFVSLDEEVPKGKCFANVEEVKQKTETALKGIKIDEFKNCFEHGKESR